MASITPTRSSWGSRLRTSLGFNVCKACSLVLSHVSGGCISSSKTLQKHHWLPIKWRIDYKVANLMYKLLESGEPTYLRSRITSKIFRCALRSSADDRHLELCSSHTKIGLPAFHCAPPAILEHHPSLSFEADSKCTISSLPFNILLWC